MQIKLILTRKIVLLAFESEGFWNSEVAYLINIINLGCRCTLQSSYGTLVFKLFLTAFII